MPIRYRLAGVISKIKISPNLYHHLVCVCAWADGYVGRLFTLKLVRAALPRLCTLYFHIVFMKRKSQILLIYPLGPQEPSPSNVCVVVPAHPSVACPCMLLSSQAQAQVHMLLQMGKALLHLSSGLQKKKLKGVSSGKKGGLVRQASEPGGQDAEQTISHFPGGIHSWKFLIESRLEEKTFFKPLEGISVQTMLDMDRVLKDLQGVRKTTHIPRALNSFPRKIHSTAVRMLHPGSKSPWHFYPASRLPTRISPSFFQIICCGDHSICE